MPERETILVTDDDELVRELAVAILTKHGYEVVAVDSGAAALEVARRAGQRIDLLLTDVAMPAMDGVELARRLRELRPGARVLFSSGLQLPPDVAFVRKPYTPGELAEQVRAAMEGQP